MKADLPTLSRPECDARNRVSPQFVFTPFPPQECPLTSQPLDLGIEQSNQGPVTGAWTEQTGLIASHWRGQVGRDLGMEEGARPSLGGPG